MPRSGDRSRLRTAVVVGLAALFVGVPVVLAGGKPGYPDKVVWHGQTWQVKSSRSPVGPGPCLFQAGNVSVDGSGQLHLRIVNNVGTWSCAEVIAPTSLGYGTYTFNVVTPVGGLDPNVVLGLFTWSDKAAYAHREIDVEIARWASTTDTTNAQYVVQPYDSTNHLKRFSQPNSAPSSFRFTWRAGSVAFARLAGTTVYDAWTYTGSDVPRPGDERARLNLWLYRGVPPMNLLPVEIVVSSFAFTP